jgi:carbamoyltransferase
MYILGISAFYHDSAACIVRKGVIMAAAQEERFTRKKHDPSFPINAIQFCLDQAQIRFEDVEKVVFYDKPFIKFERILETFYEIAPKGIGAFVKHIPEWIKEKIFFKKLLKDGLSEVERGNHKNCKILFSEHHLSHAAWAYYTSQFDESAILTIDGVGEWTTTSIFSAKGNEITVEKEQHFPHSLGLLYSSFTQYLGFKVNDGEYKMMGLAPYGDRESDIYKMSKEKIASELVDLYEDGSIKLNMSYFEFLYGERMISSKKWETLFGIPLRNEDEPIEQKHCDFALAAQDVTEEAVLNLAREAKKITGMKNLCLAGGVAYNCVANGRLLNEGIFDNVFVPPAVGDSGSAGGAALASYYLQNEVPRAKEEFLKNKISFLGPEYSPQHIEAFLLAKNVTFERIENKTALCERAATLLVNGAVIGWMQGRMEFGARALGARSIIASPLSPDIQRIVNQKIKFRESFRPFAPVMLEEDLENYFKMSEASPYMGLVTQIKDEFQKKLPENFQQLSIVEKSRVEKSTFPGITHVDYSSRIQTVDKTTNPNFWPLLKAYKELTGNSLLINTSFNVKDEPIVCSPEDAYRCFMKTEMDYLFLGEFLLTKKK